MALTTAEFTLPRRRSSNRNSPVRWIVSHGLRQWVFLTIMLAGATIIYSFWLVLAMLPAGAALPMQLAAFVLFRVFDIAKPPPIRALDQRIKNGLGVMLDDLVAAFYTLLVLALVLRLF